MRPVDVCTTILITTGNHALRESAHTRWDDVEELMGISLRPESRQASRVTMVGEQELIARFMTLSAEVEPVSEGTAEDAEETAQWNQFFAPAPGASSLSFEYLPLGAEDEVTVARDLNGCRTALTRALKAVQDFAQQQELKYWSKHFRRCLLRLSLEPQPLDDLLELLMVNGLSVPALQLVNAAMASNVFGGMGSWNGLTFEGANAPSYQVLSDRLLSAMRAAYRAGINTSAT